MTDSYVDAPILEAFDKSKSEAISLLQSASEDSALFVQLNTIPITPLREGELESSFIWVTEKVGFSFKTRFEMSAFSDNGYDYARIQHENEEFNHPIRGTAKYLYLGLGASEYQIFALLEDGLVEITNKNFG